MSFRGKILLGIFSVQLTYLLLLMFSSSFTMSRHAAEDLHNEVDMAARLVTTTITDALLGYDLATLEAVAQEVSSLPNVVFVRIRSEQQSLAEAGDEKALAAEFVADTATDNIDGSIFRLSREIRVGGSLYGIVEMGVSTANISETKVLLIREQLGIALFGLLLSGLLAASLSRFLRQRLSVLSAASQALSQGRFGYQVKEEGNDELASLAATFNTMSSKLKKMYEQQARVLKQVSQQAAMLEESEHYKETLLKNIGEGMLTISETGLIQSANPVAEKLLAMQGSGLLNRSLQEFIPDLNLTDIALGLFNSPEHNQYRGEAEALRKDGSVISVGYVFTAVRMNDHRNLVMIMRDISERKAMERMKNEFISAVSHELRTPVTAIRGSLRLVNSADNDKLAGRVDDLLKIAERNSDRLVNLVNDILDIEKIELGSMQFKIETLEMVDLINEALLMNRSFAEQFEVQLVLENEADVSVIKGDRQRLLQVLTNLLSNAAKFSPPRGKVVVSMEVQANQLLIKVSDQGNGVPIEHQSRIFEKFAQVDGSDTRKRGGTGLGLSISKAIVENLGGKIGVYSQAGRGATFFFSFPLCQMERQLDQLS